MTKDPTCRRNDPNPGLLIAIAAVVILAIGMIAGLYVAYRRRTFGG